MKKRVVAIAALIVVGYVVLAQFGERTLQSAPYSLPDSPMVAYRITGREFDVGLFGDDPNSIRGYAIVQRQVITDAQLRQDVIDVLDSRLIYGMTGAECFEPGIAVRMGDGPGQVDALICLACKHIYFFRGGQVAYRNLNSTGDARIKELYARLFPGHTADVPDADTQSVAAARDRERERRGQALDSPAAKPATEPAR